MALDIEPGDFLIVGSATYPIRAVDHYESHPFGASAGFARMASVTCSTKRSPAVTSGKRGTPTTKLASLTCTPLDPVSSETAVYLNIKTPYTTRQTIISDDTDFARVIIDVRRD